MGSIGFDRHSKLDVNELMLAVLSLDIKLLDGSSDESLMFEIELEFVANLRS